MVGKNNTQYQKQHVCILPEGMWIKDGETILFIDDYFDFSGKNKISEITADKITFSNSEGKTFTAIKIKQDINNIEQLNYNREKYFNTSDNTPKLKIDKTKIPWKNAKSTIAYLYMQLFLTQKCQ